MLSRNKCLHVITFLGLPALLGERPCSRLGHFFRIIVKQGVLNKLYRLNDFQLSTIALNLASYRFGPRTWFFHKQRRAKRSQAHSQKKAAALLSRNFITFTSSSLLLFNSHVNKSMQRNKFQALQWAINFFQIIPASNLIMIMLINSPIR